MRDFWFWRWSGAAEGAVNVSFGLQVGRGAR